MKIACLCVVKFCTPTFLPNSVPIFTLLQPYILTTSSIENSSSSFFKFQLATSIPYWLSTPSRLECKLKNTPYNQGFNSQHPLTSDQLNTKSTSASMAPSFFRPEQSTVCVMDASGRLGSALVNRLLKQGYSVNAAVQNLGDMQQLKASFPGNEKLKTFHCDLFDYKSITDALRGCSGLFYSFEPPKYQLEYDEFMADIEVRAAHNVLEACAQIDTIDKVVFTSSATAVVWRNDRTPDSPDFDERNWSDIALCRNFKLWHAMSKTLAEKTAWALAMDRDVSMVSVNAGLILTDDLSINDPFLKGAAEMYDGGVLVTVDLDFLVNAHITVFEDISSYGRYLCFNKAICTAEQAIELAELLTRGVPSTGPPKYDHDRKVIEQRISNKKLNKLIVEYGMSGGNVEELVEI